MVHQALYQVDPPIEGHEYVILSTSYWKGSDLIRDLIDETLVKETYIFPADKDGKISDWLELEGSQKESICHAEILLDAGYTIVP